MAKTTHSAGGAAAVPAPDADTAAGGRRPRRAMAWASSDVLRAGLVLLGLYFGLQLLWMVHPVLLTGFVGLLFGLGVARGADHLERLHVPRGISAPVLVLAAYCALAGVLAVAAPTLNKQFGELRRRLPQAMDRVDAWVAANRGNVWGEIFAGSSEGGGEGEGSTQSAEPAQGPKPALPPATTPAVGGAPGGGAAAAGPRTGGPSNGAPGGAKGSPAGAPGAGGAAPQDGAGPASPGKPGPASPGKPGPASPGKPGPASPRKPGAVSPVAPGVVAAAPPGAASTAPGGAGEGAEAPSPLRLRLAHQLGAMTQYLFPFLSSTVEVLAGLLLITFVAIFFGLDPLTYRRGLLHLVPHSGRERADEVLAAIGLTLRRWLATQLFAMLVIGSLVSISLALLGVEAALSLGIIAGVLEFIPTVGAIMAAIPAIAMGFLVSPQKALTVAIVFTLVQLLEGHLLIPMLMKRGMNLPPLITILGQAVMAVIFGFLGLLVAVPMLAVVMTTVKMLYVNDVVGDGVSTGAGT